MWNISVGTVNSLTFRLGEYIDYFLQLLVQDTQAYLKDTKHIIQLLQNLETTNDTILTAYVSSLYTNIDHEGVIEAARWALNKSHMLTSKYKKIIIKALDFCLKHNF